MKTYLFLFITILFFTYGCVSVTDDDSGIKIKEELKDNEIKDIDGNKYRTVIIGNQKWMAENLRVTTFNDSTFLREYNYYNDKNSCFYSSKVIYNDKNICPYGWHVPSKKDWEILKEYVGDSSSLKLKSVIKWQTNGIDSYNFSANPSGYYEYDEYNEKIARWWTSTKYTISAYDADLDHKDTADEMTTFNIDNTSEAYIKGHYYINYEDYHGKMCIRCIQN
jgi:uncharacterized protein (TIGR02145 family)